MLDKRQEILTSSGRIIFVALLFLVVASFTNKQKEQANFSSRYETLAELQPNSAHAVITHLFVLPTIQNSQPTVVDNSGISLYNDSYKVMADNKTFSHRFIVLQQKTKLQKPLFTIRFYYHLFPIAAQDPPALS